MIRPLVALLGVFAIAAVVHLTDWCCTPRRRNDERDAQPNFYDPLHEPIFKE